MANLDNHRFILNMSAIIFNDNCDVLIVHRSPKEDRNPNVWGIAGGKVDSTDHDLMSALAREIKEETGMTMLKAAYFDSKIAKTDDGNKLYGYCICKCEGDVQISDEADDYKWISRDDLKTMLSLDFTPNTHDLLERAFKAVLDDFAFDDVIL